MALYRYITDCLALHAVPFPDHQQQETISNSDRCWSLTEITYRAVGKIFQVSNWHPQRLDLLVCPKESMQISMQGIS